MYTCLPNFVYLGTGNTKPFYNRAHDTSCGHLNLYTLDETLA